MVEYVPCARLRQFRQAQIACYHLGGDAVVALVVRAERCLRQSATSRRLDQLTTRWGQHTQTLDMKTDEENNTGTEVAQTSCGPVP